jgi:hypothetical protein
MVVGFSMMLRYSHVPRGHGATMAQLLLAFLGTPSVAVLAELEGAIVDHILPDGRRALLPCSSTTTFGWMLPPSPTSHKVLCVKCWITINGYDPK